MARKVFFFDDDLETQRAFAAQLMSNGYDLSCPGNLSEAETKVEQGECDLVIFSGPLSSPSWQICQALEARFPWLPFLYVLVNDSEVEPHVKDNELHRIVRPLSSRPAFLARAEELIRVGEMSRRLSHLNQLESGSNALDQMFTRLDAAHIIDRVLHYFGSRLDAKNIHWLIWRDLPHFLEAETEILNIEMEIEGLRGPRLMSYLDAEIAPLMDLLHQTMKPAHLEILQNEKYLFSRSGSENVLYVAVESLVEQKPLGCLMIEGVESSEVAAQILETLKLMSRFIEFGLSHWDSRNLAMTDDLTSLYNQRFLPTVLENEINRAQRSKQSFSVLFMDLDYFKMVNDTRGHWIGSALIKEVGKILKAAIRSCDFGFRYGGDEFVVILPDTDIKGGEIVAERIRKSIEDARFLIDGHDLRLTVSVGLAAYPQHARTKEQILKMADQAMYYGKRKSRNIVYIAS